MTWSEIGLLLTPLAIHGWAAGIVFAAGCRALFALMPESVPRLRQAIASAAFAGVAALAFASGAISAATPTVRLIVPRAEATSVTGEAGPGWFAGPLAAIWVGVALVLLIREAAGHVRLFRMRKSWRAIPAELKELHPVLNGGAFLTGPAGVPMTVGLLDAVTFLPAPLLADESVETIARIARHELAHARWRDPLTSALTRLLRIALWPVLPLYWIERIAASEAEAAADRAALLAEGGADARVEYAETLLDLAQAARLEPPLAAAALMKGALTRRVRRIVGVSPRSPAQMLLAAVLLAASASAAAALPQLRVEIAALPDGPSSFREWIESIEHPATAGRRQIGDDEVRIVAPASIRTVDRIVISRE